MKRLITCVTLGSLLVFSGLLYAQTGTAVPGSGTDAVSINNMTTRTTRFVCGGKAQAGTPITGLGAANNTGTITISGIPATAIVDRADLFWTVLTNDAETSTLGQNITLNGQPVVGFKIGTSPESPCFPQAHTISYRSIVTALVGNPGNGVYTVSGLPVGPHWSEGVTLQVLYADPNGALMEDNLYHATTGGLLAVTRTDLFSQDLAMAGTNASGPVTATLYEVIGNGQVSGTEALRFNGPCSQGNFDNTLDGSTVAKAAGTCTLSPFAPECYWDDDVHNVSAQFACGAGNSATSAQLKSDPADLPGMNDCFDWPALNLLTSTDNAVVCAAGGTYVDNQCPAANPWRNHGQYMDCVSSAAIRFLGGLPYGGSCPRAEIQSCIVNPRARSNVGKK